ncbi:MAG: NUDIX domain-containing protein [Candidatus Saganbacteria bacterium]|nr:NUDIX domain-containing protein [Candidatus Saganbacteria bacterium]
MNLLLKIKFLDARASLQHMLPQRHHISGYISGDSPGTDLLPVIDPSGNILRHENRKIVHGNGLLHASVHLLIFNEFNKNEILIQKRGSKKAVSPKKISQPVGGHVSKGFTPEETLVKEANEELGIDLKSFEFVKTFFYKSDHDRNQELVYLFTANYSGPIRPNPSEVYWAAFVKIGLLFDLINKRTDLFTKGFLRDLDEYFGENHPSGRT